MLRSADRIGQWVVDTPTELEGLGAAFSAHRADQPERRCTLLVVEPEDFTLTAHIVEQQIAQLGRPDSDTLIPIVDWGRDTTRGLIWIAAPPLRGVQLTGWLAQGSKIPPQVRRMVDDIVGALEVLREQKVQLGWLCPAQFMVDAHGHIKLLPAPSPFLTTPAGTAHLRNLRYLAPEYFEERQERDAVAGGDLYSLAIFAFEALLGRSAFLIPPGQTDTFGTLRNMKSQDGGLDVGADFPIGLRRALWQATHSDGTKRPVDPLLLAEALGPPPAKVSAAPTPAPAATVPEADTAPEATVETDATLDLRSPPPSEQSAPPSPDPEAQDEPIDDEDWSWHEEAEADPVAVDVEGDDVELESYSSIRDSIWIRVLFVAAVLAGLVLIWFFVDRAGDEDEQQEAVVHDADRTRDRTVERLAQQPGARSDAYEFPASWRERTSAETWTRANFPEAWLEAIAPESWKQAAFSGDQEKDELTPLPAAPQPPPGFGERELFIGKELRHEGAVDLRGIWAESSARFGLPDTWELWGDPVLHLDLEHSDQLLTHVSTLGVWADGQPSASFFVEQIVAAGGSIDAPVRLLDSDGYHSLQFAGYHRAQLPCEGDIGDELWTRLTERTSLSVFYREVPPQQDLTRWPYPFVDQRHPDPFEVTIVLPPQPSEAVLHAAGLLAATLRRAADWHRIVLRSHIGSLQSAPAGHAIVVAELGGDQANQLLTRMQASPDPEINKAVSALTAGSGEPGSGVLALLPRGGDPNHLALAVVGRDGPGLESLALLLADERASDLLRGSAEYIEALTPSEPMEPRVWRGAIPPTMGFTLMEMGYGDLMATGFRGGKVTIPIHHVPDEKFDPGRGRLSLSYSYSAQVDPGASKLWVYLDKDPLVAVDLEDLDGRHRQSIEVDIPVQRIGPDSVLDVVFDLRGYEDHSCLGAAHSFLWGTVHADSRIRLPRETWRRLNDLGLLRFGAYPLGIRADLSETTFILPEAPSDRLIEAYVLIAAELGRLSRGDRLGFGLRLGAEATDGRATLDAVVIDEGPEVALLEQLDLAQLDIDDEYRVGAIATAHAQVAASSERIDDGSLLLGLQAAPWNGGRSVLVARLEGSAPTTVFDCGDALGPAGYLHGRSARLSDCGPVEVLSGRREAYSGKLPIKAGVHRMIRKYYWSLVAIAVLLVAIMLLIRYRRRANVREHEAVDAEDNSHFYHPDA
jgi:hypothetical protein